MMMKYDEIKSNELMLFFSFPFENRFILGAVKIGKVLYLYDLSLSKHKIHLQINLILKIAENISLRCLQIMISEK